jgi:CHAT domain-containing protein
VTADEAADNQGKFYQASEDLYRALIEPVEGEISSKKRLVIIPNGVLYYIPFQVLGYAENDSLFHFLIEDFEILYTSELNFSEDEETDFNRKIYAMGNADSTLPYAEKEVIEIKSIYPDAMVYVRDSATRDKVINIPVEYNILHLATHGILDYNSFENSYLIMAESKEGAEDGKLSINDIYQITNLSTYDMVTLSACETAVTFEMIEGWPVTTASAFLDLGVVTVIASLWSVDDEATNILMKNFYENLKSMGKLEALHYAQIEMIQNSEYSHPYYWAPFLLIGDWR